MRNIHKWHKLIITKEDLEEYYTSLIESGDMLKYEMCEFDHIRYFMYNDQTYTLYDGEYSYDFEYTFDDIWTTLYNIIRKQPNKNEYMCMILKNIHIDIYKASDFKKNAGAFGNNRATGKLKDFMSNKFACIDTNVNDTDVVEMVGVELLKDYCEDNFDIADHWSEQIYWSDDAFDNELPEKLYEWYRL